MYNIYIYIYNIYIYNMYRMDEELDAETLMRGGVHFVCPICLEKRKQVEESYLKFCCGQDICITCSDSYRDECARKSLKFTCVYCRAEVLSEEESNRLLKKRGSNHVCINMIDI
jgi:hypothetical protein